MAFSAADGDAIRTAIAQGVLEVDYGGRRTRFRSLQEMRETLAMIDAEVAASNGATRPRQWLAYSAGKGI